MLSRRKQTEWKNSRWKTRLGPGLEKSVMGGKGKRWCQWKTPEKEEKGKSFERKPHKAQHQRTRRKKWIVDYHKVSPAPWDAIIFLLLQMDNIHWICWLGRKIALQLGLKDPTYIIFISDSVDLSVGWLFRHAVGTFSQILYKPLYIESLPLPISTRMMLLSVRPCFVASL